MSSYATRNGTGGPSQAASPAGQTQYSQSIAKSMTIDEMRQLHQRALSDAEAKKTELRLVLASRYRELVGSSDEVLKMRERSEELHELVCALPTLMEKLLDSTKPQDTDPSVEQVESAASSQTADRSINLLRHELSLLSRGLHRALAKNDVHRAATCLIRLFTLIARQTDQYPLANALAESGTKSTGGGAVGDPLLSAQTKMTFLHVQTIPERTVRLAKQILLRAAAHDEQSQSADLGAQRSAAAISTLDLLDVSRTISQISAQDRAAKLIDLYFDSKAKLLHSLLNQLTTEKSTSTKQTMNHGAAVDDEAIATASAAEEILSKIVLILQHDIIVHPYQVFILRKFPTCNQTSSVESIMQSLPPFDPDLIKSKASHFLAANLPLIRTKVKSILVTIAGTTASALGKIRQSLYDKTDGAECMERLDSNTICSWEQAVNGMVDFRIVLSHGQGFVSDDTKSGALSGVGSQQRKFSLWSVLFSNIFSSLVHSLLSTSFHSVHARVVSTLRTSLANAPPLSGILPHEAYRNTLRIATDLDVALLKVSDDAHELLVHAEERLESERRLRQSLYVQTCEIMGRLLSELRRMLQAPSSSDRDTAEATKELIVGRLCHLLKFRLTSLPTLLNSSSSPAMLLASTGSSGGMITMMELQSAFDLADDNDDGLITFEEAMEAVDSAFSGTQFHGAEMLRETLLLSSSEKDTNTSSTGQAALNRNVTLNELILLSARGLRHESSGSTSALGTIQRSLDDIIESCFTRWARAALQPATESFAGDLKEMISTACTSSESEWRRIRHPTASGENPALLEMIAADGQHGGTKETENIASIEPVVGAVSSYAVGYLLSVCSVLNRSVSPSDSLPPVPSADYAVDMGILCQKQDSIPNMMDTIRWSLLHQTLHSVATVLDEEVSPAASESTTSSGDAKVGGRPNMRACSPSALVQLAVDISFLKLCLFQRNKYGFPLLPGQPFVDSATSESVKNSRMLIEKVSDATDALLGNAVDMDMVALIQLIDSKHRHVMEACDLFLSSLFGVDSASATPSVAQDVSDDVNLHGASMGSAPLLSNPLPSSRRFVLLPIQSDRSLSELQLRGKYRRDKHEEGTRDQESYGVVSSGLGFFSSILSKK